MVKGILKKEINQLQLQLQHHHFDSRELPFNTVKNILTVTATSIFSSHSLRQQAHSNMHKFYEVV